MLKSDLTSAQSVVAHGLDLIFKVSSSETSSIASSQYELFDYGSNIDLSDCMNRSPRKPCRVNVLPVDDLNSSVSMEAILGAEGRRDNSHWLIVYLRGSTTALLFPPRKTWCLSHSRFTACLEWLEEVGVSQILIAVPRGDSESFKSFLFLGFSRLSDEVVDDQFPRLCNGYVILVTNLSELGCDAQ